MFYKKLIASYLFVALYVFFLGHPNLKITGDNFKTF